MPQKMVVLKLAAIQAHLTDVAVPLSVAQLLEVRKALPAGFDLQTFSIEVYEHAPDEKLPGEVIPPKERMN